MRTERTERCTRSWQAEALEDGRLSPADSASFERHVATCEVCRREVEALAQLKLTAERMPVLASTPLEHRRLRHEVLRHAHEASVQAPQRTRAKLAFIAAALALGSALLFFATRGGEPPPRATAPHAPRAGVVPEYDATASADAVWHTLARGRVLRLALERGQLELTVEHLQPDQRFLVQLPDGELEVKGTRFVVRADGTRTTSVRVIDGRVALRLRDEPPSLLSAGDAFTAEVPVSVPLHVPGASSGPLEPNSTRTPKRTVPEPPLELPAEAPPAESIFARAMTAFSAGDFGRADALFEQFEREHPRDSRIEDALFLRAVARARRGDDAGARAIARDYLARFPGGLRKADAERLAR